MKFAIALIVALTLGIMFGSYTNGYKRPPTCHHNDGKGFASVPNGSTFPVDITRFTKGDYTNAFEVVIDVCRYCHEPVIARTGYSTPVAVEDNK